MRVLYSLNYNYSKRLVSDFCFGKFHDLLLRSSVMKLEAIGAATAAPEGSNAKFGAEPRSVNPFMTEDKAKKLFHNPSPLASLQKHAALSALPPVPQRPI
jgi:hypothetical protein